MPSTVAPVPTPSTCRPKRALLRDAAVAAAARDVLVPLIGQLPLELVPQPCIDAGVASVEADYTAALAAIPDNQAKAQGIAVGQAAAAAILALRADDGAVGPFLNFNCPQDTNPGEYQCTPGTPFIVFEVWENVTPFVLKDSSQFRPGPPYAVNKKKYTADFNEVKSLGGDDITTPSERTADQTEIALYWWESSPLKWNRVARVVSADAGLDLWENARLFGLLNMALADGYIAMVDSKNHYNYWRPVTAIQTGDTDGNPDTTGDPALDTVARDSSGPGLRLGSLNRRGRGCGSAEAVLRHRPDQLPGLQRDAACW